MARGRGRPRGPKSLAQKVGDLDPAFYDEVQSLTREQLDEKVLKIALYQGEMDAAQEKDDDLKRLREQVKIAGSTYRETKKATKLKTKYLLELKAAKGG